jgi:hypothetical protein
MRLIMDNSNIFQDTKIEIISRDKDGNIKEHFILNEDGTESQVD